MSTRATRPEVFRNARSDFGATPAEYNGKDDHLHLLAGYPPKVPITTLANSLKGVPARKPRQRYQARTHRQRP